MAALIDLQKRLKEYVPFRLTADLSRLSDKERRLVPLLLEAAAAMETPFWIQNYGDPDPLLASIKDADLRRYVQENYGPWDKLHRDEPILAGVDRKPAGASFYPADITPEEFEGPRYRRIHHIKSLMEEGRLGADLRWQPAAAAS